ncbi:LPS assembly lipoprotein LptE [Fodinicurvata sp. EGI_FJ10296]|uniref:LPS assembly lipoprotein LptE n=1 Tax=Fodinicurvata sp. EGI_FJ10296 TaxID=3231908 RepID=UPI003456EB01
MSSRRSTAERAPAQASVSRRQLLQAGMALAGLSALAGCGFRPVYGTLGGAGAEEELAAIDVSVIAEREGQQLRTYLIRMLNPRGRPVDPGYRLNVTLTESQANLAVQDGRSGTRRNLTMAAQYTLSSLDGGEGTSGSLRTITSYNRQNDEFATLSAERDARERALVQTAEDIRIALATHFSAVQANRAAEPTP